MRLVLMVATVVGVTVLAACDRSHVPKLDAVAPQEGAGAIHTPAALANILPEARVMPEASPSCGEGMLLVDGDYCPSVQHQCLEYLDPPGEYEEFRCARYARPAKCLSGRIHKRFCIDRDEYVAPGDTLPKNFQSLTHARKTCRTLGKRVCLESEWNFACEGEEMRPYPYGWERDASACNADHFDIVDSKGELRDRRARADEYPGCTSPFGVRNLSGNLEEFVEQDRIGTPAMKGAYWQPGRNFCRAAQTAHDRFYNGMETGFRCCADAAPPGEE